jgi:carbon monoxide dehydrogenase subunit G
MESFSTTVTIDRPVHEVFAFVSSIENVPTWNTAIGEEPLTVTELAPDRRVAVEGTVGTFPAHLRYDVWPAGEGTMLTSDVTLDVTGPNRLVGGLAVEKLKDAVAQSLGELKRTLEASTSRLATDRGGHA